MQGSPWRPTRTPCGKAFGSLYLYSLYCPSFNHCLHVAHFHRYLHDFRRTGIMSPTMPTTMASAIVSCLVGCCHVAQYVCFPCLYVDQHLQDRRYERMEAIASGERPPPTSALVSLPPRRPMTPPLPAGVSGAHTDPQTSCALFTSLPYELRELVWNEYLSGFRFHLHNSVNKRDHLQALVYRNEHDFPWSYPWVKCDFNKTRQEDRIRYTNGLLALPLSCRRM